MTTGFAGGYNTETPQISERALASSWMALTTPGPHQKEATDRTEAFIRTEMREKGFTRRIITPQLLTDAELDRVEDSDIPVRIVEKEPDSVATYVTFRGAGPRRWIRTERYTVRMGLVTSARHRKNKFELMTWRMDPKKVLADNSVKDCAKVEDTQFMTTAAAAVDANPAEQLVEVSSRLSRDGIVTGLQQMLDARIPNGVMLCTQQLWLDLARLTADNIGDMASDRIIQNGVEEQALFGLRTITTIKNDVVDKNDLWIFAPEQYLGNFFMLQDTTLFIEQRGMEFQFFVYEALGIGIGNTRGIIRVRFNRPLA